MFLFGFLPECHVQDLAADLLKLAVSLPASEKGTLDGR